MSCQNCDSDRLVEISGRTEDSFTALIGEEEYEGRVPKDLGIGQGDYIKFEFCLECGQIQGDFPRKETALEMGEDEDEDEEFEEEDDDEDD